MGWGGEEQSGWVTDGMGYNIMQKGCQELKRMNINWVYKIV